MKTSIPAFVLLALAVSGVASAAPKTELRPQEIKACPDEYPVESIKLSPAPPGWVAIGPAKLLLTSADVILGAPNKPGVLIGSRRKTSKGYTMTFEHLDKTGAEPVEKWLACRYGTDLALGQKLPDATDRCVVSYVKDAYNGHDIQVACRITPTAQGNAATSKQR